jgi:hypothetical protein
LAVGRHHVIEIDYKALVNHMKPVMIERAKKGKRELVLEHMRCISHSKFVEAVKADPDFVGIDMFIDNVGVVYFRW